MLQENFLGLVESMRPMILDAGHNPAEVDRWISNAKEELKSLKKHMYVNVREHRYFLFGRALSTYALPVPRSVGHRT